MTDNMNEKEDGSKRSFGYINLTSDPIRLAKGVREKQILQILTGQATQSQSSS